MGRKIFASYKYHDQNVQNLTPLENSTARNYVDELERHLGKTDHIYKGEHANEDLSHLSHDTIWAKLKDRIYDSTLTIVFISPGMRDATQPDRNQWIPWEISYSLKEASRRDSSGNPVHSLTNAMIAVILPDSNGSYSYYLEERTCCASGCRMHHTNKLFEIIRLNKFNKDQGQRRTCNLGDTVWTGECSYIEAVKWCDFIKDIDWYIERAYSRLERLDEFKIAKEV